jgi:hypothetical protein
MDDGKWTNWASFRLCQPMPGQELLLDFERFVFLLGTTTTTDDWLIVFAARLDEIVKAPCPSMIEGGGWLVGVVVVVVALAPLSFCVADGKIKSCFSLLTIYCATASGVIGDVRLFQVLWSITKNTYNYNPTRTVKIR